MIFVEPIGDIQNEESLKDTIKIQQGLNEHPFHDTQDIDEMIKDEMELYVQHLDKRKMNDLSRTLNDGDLEE